MSTGIGCNVIIITIITAGIIIITTITAISTIIVVATVIRGPVLIEMDTIIGADRVAIGGVCGGSSCRKLAKQVLVTSGPIERGPKLLSQGRCGGSS